MPVVHIPSLMQNLTGGVDQVEVPGSTVRQVIESLEERFPGIRDRLCSEGRIRPTIAVWVDGEATRQGLIQPVTDRTEIHFLPALSGG